MIDFILSLLMLAMPDVPADLQKAVDDLGHEKYHIRTAATRKLLTSKEEQIVPILATALKSDIAEVRLRAKIVLEYQWEKMIGPNRDYPWISALPKDYKNRDSVITKYRSFDNMDWEDTYFVSEREDTKKLVFDLLREGKSKDEIMDMLNKMWKNEEQWTKDGPRRYHVETPDFEN